MPDPGRSSSPIRHPARWTTAFIVVAVALAALAGPAVAAVRGSSAPATTEAASGNGMTAFDAVVLGVVEGVTEFLPISSTGHLTVTQHLLGIGTDSPQAKEAADAYAVVIQAGAILAIVALYWRRLVSLLEGLLGRDEEGRRVLVGLVLAVAPIAVVGTLTESKIKDLLFGVGPVIFAWIVGGVVVLVLSYRGWWGADPVADPEAAEAAGTKIERTAGFDSPVATRTRRRAPLESITVRQALVIGAAQVLALWPGTSRSLVTIIAALAVGLSLAAAVEFSFLLGLAVLSAATLYDAAKHGKVIVETFGWFDPVLGFVVAFGSAIIAVRWMVTYLQRHSLAIFGWYRLGIAALVGLLWIGGRV